MDVYPNLTIILFVITELSTCAILADNGIKEKAYYYWLRKFRREACEQVQLPAVTPPAEVSFAEFHIPVSIPEKLENHSAATIRANGITLEIACDISEPLLRMLLQEVVHA